ncbi:MAG: EamA family transporter [Bacillota bacterium]|nr:EamA family transporter [Bacillota bacterium]
MWREETRGYLLIAGATVFWALSGTLAKFLFSNRPIAPLVLVEFRLLGSFVLLALVLAIFDPSELELLRVRLLRRADAAYFLTYGTVGMAMVQLSYFLAISEGSVATAIFLQYLAPVFTALYVGLARRGLPEKGVVSSLLLALCGSGLLLLGGGAGLTTSRLGLLAGLASAGFMSFYTVYGARGVQRYGPRTLLLGALGVGGLALVPFFPPWRVLDLGWTAADWLFLLYLAVFGTLIPFMMFLAGLRTVAPVQATLTAMLEPVLATTFAWVLLGESLRPPQLAGGALIIAAVAHLQVSRARRAAAQEAKA